MKIINWDKYDRYSEFNEPGFRPEKLRKAPSSLDVKVNTRNLISPMALYTSTIASLPNLSLTKQETKELFKEYNWIKHDYLAKFKLLNSEEQKLELREEKLKELEEPRQELMLSYIKLAIKKGADFWGYGIDAIEEGNIGLMIAIDRYRHNYGDGEVPFHSYAARCIEGYILRALSEEKLIRIPPSARRKLKQIKSEHKRLSSLYERVPTLEELEESTQIYKSLILKLLAADNEMISLDTKRVVRDEYEEVCLADIIKDEGESKEAIVKEIAVKRIKEYLDFYSNNGDRARQKEAFVIQSWFFENKRFREIGQELDVTRARIGQIKDKGLINMRRDLGEEIALILS